MFPKKWLMALTVLLLPVLGWTAYDAGAHFALWGPEDTRLQAPDVARLVEIELTRQVEDIRDEVFSPGGTPEEQYQKAAELTTRYNALREKQNWRISYRDGVWTAHTGVLVWRVHDRTMEIEAPGYSA